MKSPNIDMCQGLNSHCFHIIGDGHQPNSVGLYIPIIRIPSLKVEVSHPQKNATFDHGTHENLEKPNPPNSKKPKFQVPGPANFGGGFGTTLCQAGFGGTN